MEGKVWNVYKAKVKMMLLKNTSTLENLRDKIQLYIKMMQRSLRSSWTNEGQSSLREEGWRNRGERWSEGGRRTEGHKRSGEEERRGRRERFERSLIDLRALESGRKYTQAGGSCSWHSQLPLLCYFWWNFIFRDLC